MDLLRSIGLFVSALAVVVLTMLPATQSMFVFPWIYLAAHLADTMFHECGHAVFAWAMGHPAIPSILTAFGSDQASGVTLTMGHSWIVQAGVWAAMAYGCWWLWRQDARGRAIGAGVLAGALAGLSLWEHASLVWTYMGHGSAMLVGGFFLYRGVLNLSARSMYERWLNLFLGLFMLLDNGRFAWQLAFDATERAHYEAIAVFGGHHDYAAMADEWYRLSVKGVAEGAVVEAVLVTLAALLLAYWHRFDDYEA